MDKLFIRLIRQLNNTIRQKSLVAVLSALVVVFAVSMLVVPGLALGEDEAKVRGGIDLMESVQEAESAPESGTPDAGDAEAQSGAGGDEDAAELPQERSNGGETTGGEQASQDGTEDAAADQKAGAGGTLTLAGSDYRVTVTYGPEAGLPSGAALEVSEITGDAYDEYFAKAAFAMDAAGFEYARIFDISIVDGEGSHVTPLADVDVRVRLSDGVNKKEDFAVVHFEGRKEKPQQVETESGGGVVTFSTGSFSAYAIVQGPSSIPLEWTRIASMDQFRELAAEGLYIGTTSGYYLQNEAVVGSQDATTTGILKTKPAHNLPGDDAVLYYFEDVEGTTNQFYIYCYDDGGNKQYVHNNGDQNLTFVGEDEKTAFTMSIGADSRVRFNNGNRYWNMWNGANGNNIAAYTNAGDGNNYMYLWHHDGSYTGDPYDLDGKTYGLMNWVEGTTGKALMGTSSNANSLDGMAMTVMSKSGANDDKLYVTNDSDITMWTFDWIEDDKYYLTAVVDGSTKYLKITSSGLTMVSTPDASCRLQVVPGTGTHDGELCLKNGNTTLSYTGNIDNGFKVGGAAGNEWLRLTELSELTTDYIMTYSAKKVSVSDESVTNGSKIIVYTRVWNEEKKHYEFYAVDNDGSLIPCYEEGDSIEWVGSRLNSLLWNFVEYYWEGTTDPNYYYELYNPYSESYIAPQVTDGQTLSDETIGINLTGRRAGRYYSPIIAWDDENYAYVGLKADVESGRIVSCPRSEADDFYFAIMEDIPVDDELFTVNTVDNTEHGITMKMVNFPNRPDMSTFLGSNNNYVNGNTEAGLLSTDLTDGYPTTKGGNSLEEWFGSADEVNHLFLESTYNASGYYEFDSTQNFAHLNDDNTFTVYKEIGTMDNNNGKFYTHGQFMPYNDIEAGVFSSVNRKNLTASSGADLPDTDPRKYEQLYLIKNPDYYMGAEITASFTQTPNGLDNWGHDIIYEFTGDDDFWLYVDGELIIDLGGIHDAIPGSVNYRTGEVMVNGKHTTLRDLFYQNYIGRGMSEDEANAQLDEIFIQNEDGQYIFRDYTTHTMKIFYLERGAGASNLHMRFNLASIRPGTVELSKKLAGVDTTETILAEFAYQIYYTMPNGHEYRVAPGGLDDVKVHYKDSISPVTYRPSVTIDGMQYQDVYMLLPDEVADIEFPEGTVSYRIVECGINTDIYEEVTANGEVIEGTDTSVANRKDFGTEPADPMEKPQAAFVNKVDPDALVDLTVTKRLFQEDGRTPIDYEDDQTTFNFRLYLGDEFDGDDLPAAYLHTYHVKDPSGNYCRWNAADQKFESLGTDDYSALTYEQKVSASFTTSMNGSISKIPAGYTVEVRELLAGTRFRLEERPDEMPDGYTFQKYVYDGDNVYDVLPGVIDTMVSGENAHVDVCNVKGWGLRVNKTWNDDTYMDERDATYFAVYTADDQGVLTLIPDDPDDPNNPYYAVRRMARDESSLYWFFLPLPVDAPFDHYEIREVTVADPVVDADGNVTSHGAVTVIGEGGTVTLGGKQKGEAESSDFTYTVDYEKGEVPEGANVRVDSAANSRPGVVIRKTDWNGNPLAGAAFNLRDSSGSLISTFTSDQDGLITEAFLSRDKDYTLAETKTPQGYQGIPDTMTIRLTDDGLTASGVGSEYYTIQHASGDDPETLIIKNRSSSFKVEKIDGDTGAPMAGVHFALHKQITVGDVTSIDLNPMPGYADLVSNANGIVHRIDGTLPVGTYEIRETITPEGYQRLPYVQFTVGATGQILIEAAHSDWLTEEVDEVTGEKSYTITLPNYHLTKAVAFKKVDVEDPDHSALRGARFDLFRTEGGQKQEPAVYTGLESGQDGMLALDGTTVFELQNGTYLLEETKAPAGYNLRSDPVTVTVTSDGVTYDDGTTVSAGGPSYDPLTKVYTMKISNSAGAALPSTGGPGTTWIYILGALLFAVCGAGLAVRRRMMS